MNATPPPGPQVTLAPVIAASAGGPVTVEATVWHTGPRPVTLTVAVRGLDAEWTPPPVLVGPLPPGESRTVAFELRPGPSALGARYPFVVVAVAADPLGRGDPQSASAESTLIIGGREPTVLDLDPPQVTAVFGRRVQLTITNPSLTDRELVLEPTVPAGLTAQFQPGPVGVPAGRTVTVRGKVKVRRPRVFGTVQTHSYAVAARGQGAPVVVTGTVRARPVFRGALVRALVLVAVVALWAGLAVVAIPRVSSYFTTQTQDTQAGGAAPDQPSGTTPADAGAGSAGASPGGATGGDSGTTGGDSGTTGGDSGTTGGDSGATGATGDGSGGGSPDSGAPDSGSAGGGATDGGTGGVGTDTGDTSGGEAGAGGAGGNPATPGGGETGTDTNAEQGSVGATPNEVALRGLVTGPDPGGVTVVLSPTGLTQAAEQGAEPAPGTDEQTASGLRAARSIIGKVPASALRVATADEPPTITTTTNDDGTWAIAGVRPQGFYLLTMARAGYQTQRFVVNGATLIGADPMRIELIAGNGAMSGTVTGPDGPIGAATVTITDGHVSVQTSSVSPGAEGTPGSWSVTGLSTPGTYLVSAAAQGFGTSSTLVTLGAGGTATADLSLPTGAAQVTGLVSGEDLLGQLGGLGGLQVSITGQSGDVTTTRTATTVTSGPVGTYTLPDLPTPGDYTLTVSGAGYSDQVRQVSLAEGVGSVEVNVSMIRADGVVSGTVSGNPATGDQPAEGGLIGAGLTLTGPAGSTKTMTTSDPPGSYRFTGVAPGVYVLTGSMFGRISSSVTVEVAAAGQATADLTLLSSADTELPATAHIQGRVTDSRTGGDITCDRAIDPTVPCIITASVSVPAIDPNTGRIDPNLPPQIVTSQANPGENYILPAPDDPDHPGLVPGLYTVTITAPGYEPGDVSVQVPQGVTMSAAPVSLVPLSMITGRLTTRVGTPTPPTCVAVVASGVKPPDRSAGCVPDPGGVNCTVGNDPSIRCGLIQEDGTYQVRGLTHGGYTVVVLPTDPEYIEPAPFSLTIELGSDGRYDPVLDRLGRISVTVRQPDPKTGELVFVTGAIVQAVQGSTVVATGTSDANGAALLTTLPSGSYRVQASKDGASAEVNDQVVQLNHTIVASLAIIKPLGVITARVLTTDGISNAVPVVGATISVTGIVGYQDLQPVQGTATLVTDANGCIAITPVESTDPVAPPGACPTTINDTRSIRPASTGYFVARPISSVQVDATDKTQASLVAQISIEGTDVFTIPASATTVLPKPSPATNLGLLTLPAGAARSTAVLSLLSKPPGSGQVGVVETSVGTLQWTDSAVTGTNLLSPGPYSVQAVLQGFTSLPAKGAAISCPLGAACSYVANPTDPTSVADPRLRLVRNPTFTGSVTVLPTGASIASATFAVTPLNQNLPPIKLSLTGNGTGLQWQETGAPLNIVTPGDYSVAVSLPGFESTPITFSCAAPTLGTETCALPTLALTQLSTPTIIVGSNGPNLPTGATVLLTGGSIGSIGPLNTQNVSGRIQVTLPPLSSLDNTYQITVRAPGFQTNATPNPSNTISCWSGNPARLSFAPGPTSCTVTLTQLGRINVSTLQANSNGPASTLPSVTVTATPLAGGDPWTVITGTDGTAQIIGNLTREGLAFGEYRVSVSLTGYAADPQNVTIGAGSLTFSLQFVLQLQPVTVNLSMLDAGTAVLPAGTVRMVGDTATRTCVLATDNATSCTPAQPNITIANQVISLGNTKPGVYSVSFTPATGSIYQPVSVQALVSPGVDPQPLQLNLARRSSNQTGVVLGPGGVPIAGAEVTLRQNDDVTQVAKDVRGVDVPPDITDAGGTFTFTDLPDGTYRIMVDACGYDRVIGPALTVNASLVPRTAVLQVTRTLRTVTITVTSTAGANLTGAAASLQPATGGDPPSCAPPANTALTGLTVAADGTVSTTQLPTGTWSLVVTPANSPFGAVTTDPFLADQPPRGTPALPPNTVPTAPPLSFARDVRQAAMTMTATWPDECSDPPTSVTLALTQGGGSTQNLPATITPGTGNSGTATVTALVPAGSYSWSITAGTYTADPATGTFTVPATGTTPAVAIPVNLLSPGVGVRPTVTVDGTAQTGVPVTATRGGQTVTPVAGVLCVTPGGGWTFSVRSTTNPTMLIPDLTGVTVTRAGPNPVAFTGFTLRPGATLASVDRRPPDTTARPVPLTLTLAGSTVWSDSVSIPAGASAGTGPLLTVGAGSYTLAAAASAPFGAGSTTGIDPSPTHTPTVTMPYTAVTLGVTASIAGAASAGATITLTPAAGGSPKPTPATGPVVFADIDPGTYTITATQTVGATQYQGALTGQAFTAGQSPLLDVPMTAVPPPGP